MRYGLPPLSSASVLTALLAAGAITAAVAAGATAQPATGIHLGINSHAVSHNVPAPGQMRADGDGTAGGQASAPLDGNGSAVGQPKAGLDGDGTVGGQA